MTTDPTQRFTSRVADYVRYRPGYPDAVLGLLGRECGLGPTKTVADVGSGTGILTRLLLDARATVFAIEPNAAMREAAEHELGTHRGFHSVAAKAEATGLPGASVDLVVAAQAFHWFDRPAARREFDRILRAPKWTALVWNERVEDANPFLHGYEALLREFAGDYFAVRHNAIDPEDLARFFGGDMKTATFPSAQSFDLEGVVGRLMSSSYAPPSTDPRHVPMLESLHRLFDATAEDGKVDFLYETNVYYGILS